MYSCFEGVMHGLNLSFACRRVGLYGIVVHPVAGVPAVHLAFAPPVVVPGQERLVFIAEAFEGFQFAAEIDMAFFIWSVGIPVPP